MADDGEAERGGEQGKWDNGGSAGHEVLIKKRRARNIDSLAAREARRNARRAAGLDAATARMEGARPGSPEGGPS